MYRLEDKEAEVARHIILREATDYSIQPSERHFWEGEQGKFSCIDQ